MAPATIDGVIQLQPTDHWREILPNQLYAYRGVLILGDEDGLGATVGERDRPDSEIGWGSTMEDAMAVANEHVDGFERIRPARRAA